MRHDDRPSLPPLPSKSPPRRLPGAQRKAAILARALPLFAARGYAGTTTRDLARSLSVTEPVLYRHFASKEALFLEVLEGAERRILEALAASLRGANGTRERLLALTQGIDSLLASVAVELRLLHGAAAAAREPRVLAAVRRTYERLGAALSAALRDPGLRRGLSPTVAGTFLLEVGVGASLLRPLGVPAVRRRGYAPASERLLLAALT